MEMTTDMLAPEEVLAPAKQAPTAPALLTINPQEYVTQVFAPFRAKLATLKAEADTIHFDDTQTFDAPHTYVDIGTTAGMAVAVKMRAAFRDDVRLSVEKTKVARKAPILQIGRLLDSTYNEIVAEVTPYEGKFDAVIKAEEKRKADAKAAKERAEAERIGTIKAAIEAIRALPDRAAGKSAEELRALLERVAARVIAKEEFAEFDGEAQIALDAAGEELFAMYGAAQQAEAAAAKAEADRQAELKAIAEQKAEQARIAAEQAAKEKELADAAAELQRQRDQDAATARAAQLEVERLAKVEADKVAAQRAKEAQELADARAALAQEQAEFKRKQDEANAAAAADKARADAAALYAKMDKHYDKAIEEDAERTAARIAEKQVMVDEAVAAGHEQAADERVAGLPAGALGADALADALDTDEARRKAVLECAMKAVANQFRLTHPEAIAELRLIESADFDAAETLAEAA